MISEDLDNDPSIDNDNTDELNFVKGNRARRDIAMRRELKSKGKLVETAKGIVRDTKHSDALKNMLREAAELDAQTDTFNPTFKGRQFEENWLIESLGDFYYNHVITDVLGQVKGGKEANVYRCAANPRVGVPLLAAKAYRPRMFRNLKNDADYRSGGDLIGDDGKTLLKKREQRAVAARSKVGLEMLHNSWLGTESATLNKLHEAGVRVPKTYAVSHNAILMDYLGDEVTAAPPLSQVALEPHVARRMLDEIIEDIRLMLQCEIVHGDLSAFNILCWQEAFLIIDMPQATNPWKNPHAKRFFERDVTRVCEYFARYFAPPNPETLARKLWLDAFGTNRDLV
jgi:RIO kinase 1